MKISDYEEVLEDHRRLVRELDVALNGKGGAAVQASLCDLIGDAKCLRGALIKARDAILYDMAEPYKQKELEAVGRKVRRVEALQIINDFLKRSN